MEEQKVSNQGRQGITWGLGAAVVGSLCCVGPVVAVVMGLGSASFLLGFAAYRPYFLGAGLFIMSVGALVMIRRSRSCCTREQQRRNAWVYFGGTLLAFALSYGLLTYVLPGVAYRALEESAAAVSTGVGGAGTISNSVSGPTSSQSMRQAILEIRGMT